MKNKDRRKNEFGKENVKIMKNNNRIWKKAMALLLSAGLISGCGNSVSEAENAEVESEVAAVSQMDAATVAGKEDTNNGDTFKVVCTIFPEYDWVKELVGELSDNYEITMLLDNGTDLHSYQPTVEDMAKIAECDLFLYVGGDSDEWVADALSESVNPDRQVIELMEVLGDKVVAEEIVEGMEHNHDHEHEEAEEEGHDHEHQETETEEHDHEHEDGETEEHHHVHENDEHVWLSLRNTKVLVEEITEHLVALDEANADVYRANCDAYMTELEDLDVAYATAVAEGQKDTVVFADRFPFRYLVDDYELQYFAAFSGCSAESEASFETITFLAEKVNELDLQTILVIENSNTNIAETVIASTEEKNQQVKILNSMQSVTSVDVENGASYLSIMQENLEVLKEALQ